MAEDRFRFRRFRFRKRHKGGKILGKGEEKEIGCVGGDGDMGAYMGRMYGKRGG